VGFGEDGMRFADLFCGIGGFHAALDSLGHECVFATDIDRRAAEVYELNFGKPGGFDVHCDIRKVIDEIPPMDIICAGFPCQPFSKSGSQSGFKDQTRGTLFHDICYLAEKHQPAVLFLENVPNLVKHDKGHTFEVIESRIREIGYSFSWKILSPHTFGTCQIRTRVYIVCVRNDLSTNHNFEFPEKNGTHHLDVRSILDEKVNEKFNLRNDEIYWIDMWEDFLKNVNTESKLPGHPIWADSFRGTETLPGSLEELNENELRKVASDWNVELDVTDELELIKKKINLPNWKQSFIGKNRKLYKENSKFIESWIDKWKIFSINDDGSPLIPNSRRKYEWQAGPDSRSNWENIMQFRPSGIRVKRGNYFPALVAMAQIPVIGWMKRHITPKECARIQDFDVDGVLGNPFILGSSDQQSYKQLGNAVNVSLVRLIQKNIDSHLSERVQEIEVI
jgi:DNA (cytosine-5)-methyltransferase 1